MNDPQITWRGFLVILGIVVVVGTLGHIDNNHREIAHLKNTCQETENANS